MILAGHGGHAQENGASTLVIASYSAIRSDIELLRGPVLRLFPPCARISHAQGSSGVVETMTFAWRGHTESLTTRARPSPDLAVCLE